ncbi:MAG TPA: S53 family peptidase [Thermoanaerobaculaceae bacterium]|nr:S53 family peptidase [Thermoanaerobaculaceae bacterium]
MPTKRKVAGSERDPLVGARAIGPADPNERAEVTLRLRPRNKEKLEGRLRKLASAPRRGSKVQQHLTREEFESEHGAAPEDIEKVATFARTAGLAVVETSASRRTVVLSGTVAALSQAFGVHLETYEHPGGTYRGRTGPVHVPVELAGIVQAVLGLDDRPQARPHMEIQGGRGNIHWHAGGTSYTPIEVARLYGFRPGGGAGVCIGILELGGGFRLNDIRTYFSNLGVVPPPSVTAVSVDHAGNNPTGDPGGPDGEVMLDIDVAGAIAPSAKIVVYFAPNTDRGFLDAVTTAVHDPVNRPSVISISWGAPEANWTRQAMLEMDQAFQAAAALGVTICCASGDDGSSDGVPDGHPHVDFPASSPFVVACGGTRLNASGTSIVSEVTWAGSGGGFSSVFPLPDWQSRAGVRPPAGGGARGRGVPDVAADADPATGYRVRVDGQDCVIGGTSAVAPLVAALIARVDLPRRGFVNPSLYTHPNFFYDITVGGNGAFHAGKGWDPCTGLGSPRARSFPRPTGRRGSGHSGGRGVRRKVGARS